MTNAANAYQRADSCLTFALSDLDGNIIGKSLVDRLMPVEKELCAFNEYLKLKHALEWRRPNEDGVKAKQVFGDPILDDAVNIEKQNAAEKRVKDEERFFDNHKATADAYAANETMQLLGNFTTQFRASARNTLSSEEEKRDAYFLSQQYIKGFDYTESEGMKFAKALYEETGDKSVFIFETPITYNDEYSKGKVKYGM